MAICAQEVRDVLETVSPTVTRMGFSAEEATSPQEKDLFGSMGRALQRGGEGVVSVRSIPEAVKVVREGWVVGSRDRSSLVTVASPVLFNRGALEGLLKAVSVTGWINPVEGLLGAGGRVRTFTPSA